ncbi:MAG: SIS domain-containing protein [Candidatus Omnitrophota bacterium]|nr:SIS domain-containing protein [Candidatus Omnitrophota bacterium]
MRYFKELRELFLRIKANDKAKGITLDKAIQQAVDLILALERGRNKIIFIGNGGSASIASHLYTDFLKNARIPALAFNDSSLITCLSNDLGYENVFKQPIELLARRGDILFAISSSGKSKNILRATEAAEKKGCVIITLSGFNPDNPLRFKGKINFYVPAHSYGFVEIAHLAICHCILDSIIT